MLMKDVKSRSAAKQSELERATRVTTFLQSVAFSTAVLLAFVSFLSLMPEGMWLQLLCLSVGSAAAGWLGSSIVNDIFNDK